MAKAAYFVFPGPPSPWRKNARFVVFNGPKCPKCKRGANPSVLPGKLASHLTDGLPVRPVSGPVMVTIVAHWPSMHRTSRAPGQPQGDVDAVVSAVLDALSGKLYHDDAQVVLLNAVSAYDKHNPRVEVTVAPVSARVLDLLERTTGLKLTEAVLTVGQQVPL